MAAPPPTAPVSPLDRPFARLGALGVFLAVVALLGFIHRDERFHIASQLTAW